MNHEPLETCNAMPLWFSLGFMLGVIVGLVFTILTRAFVYCPALR